MICQAGVHRQYPYLFHLYNILFFSIFFFFCSCAHRGREQGGADGLGVIAAQDEKEETMGGGGEEAGRLDGGETRGDADVKWMIVKKNIYIVRITV